MYGAAWGPASPDGPASFEGFEFEGFEGLELPQAIAAIATRAVLHSLAILKVSPENGFDAGITDRPFANSGGVPAVLQNPDDVAVRSPG